MQAPESQEKRHGVRQQDFLQQLETIALGPRLMNVDPNRRKTCHDRFEEFFAKAGFRIAYFCATRRIFVFLGTLLIVSLSLVCFLRFQVESDAITLWTPLGSQALDDKELLEGYFRVDPTFQSVLVVEKSRENVLFKEAMDEIWELDIEVRAIELANGETYEDYCMKSSFGECMESGVLRFWTDFGDYAATVQDDDDLIESVSSNVYADGSFVNRQDIFGDYETDSEDNVVSARGLAVSYFFNADELDVQREFELRFLEIAQEADENSQVISVLRAASRSIDDEIAELILKDIPIVIITYVLMMTFACVVLGGKPPLRSRVMLGSSGITLILLALLTSYGFCSGIGVPYTPLANIIPFLLVGIGVDDMLIIVLLYDKTNANREPEIRASIALSRCFLSITYSSITNVIAFAFGALSTLPAIRYFAIYAAAAIFFDYLFQVTLFISFLVLDELLKADGRWDILWCISSAAAAGGDKKGIDSGRERGRPKRPFLERLFKRYANLLMQDRVRYGVLAIFGAFAISCAASLRIKQGFDIVDITADDSYLRDYFLTAREYRVANTEQNFPFAIYFHDLDYAAPMVQKEYDRLTEKALEEDNVDGPVFSWLQVFLDWVNTSSYSSNLDAEGYYDDRVTFYTAFDDFLADPSYEFVRDYLDLTDLNTIRASYVTLYHYNLTSPTLSYQSMENVRDLVQDTFFDIKPIPYHPSYLLFEQYGVIVKELLINFAAVLAVVGFISTIILWNVWAVLVVLGTVLLVDLALLASLRFYGLELNSVNAINFVIAVGLTVDYIVHIVHFWQIQNPKYSKKARVVAAMVEIGPSIFLGASTTFIGTFPLLFTSSEIFRSFGKIFLSIVFYAASHGLIFVPTLLSFMGEEPILENKPPPLAGRPAVYTIYQRGPSSGQELCSVTEPAIP